MNTLFSLLLFTCTPSLLLAQARQTPAAVYKIKKADACTFDLNAAVTGGEQTTRGEGMPELYFYTVIYNNTGDMLTQRAFCNTMFADLSHCMCRAQKGEKFYFENIRVKMADGTLQKMPAMTFVIE